MLLQKKWGALEFYIPFTAKEALKEVIDMVQLLYQVKV